MSEPDGDAIRTCHPQVTLALGLEQLLLARRFLENGFGGMSGKEPCRSELNGGQTLEICGPRKSNLVRWTVSGDYHALT